MSKKIERMIQEAIEAGKVELCDDDKIEEFGDIPYDFIKDVHGAKRVLLTDRSSLSDFGWTRNLSIKAFELYGITLTGEETLIEVSEKIIDSKTEEKEMEYFGVPIGRIKK